MVRPGKSRGRERGARVADTVGARKTKAGLVQVVLTLDPQHLALLRTEAIRRAVAAGSGRPDASAVLREILQAWAAKRTK
jgi:hypothetical protein